MGSLPVRGAWVEIAGHWCFCWPLARRSPCGERGLKLAAAGALCWLCWSLPVRGAWVEIAGGWLALLALLSLPVRGAWVEISRVSVNTLLLMSLPVRGAWVEIRFGRRFLPAQPCRSPCGERGLK